MTIFHLFFFFVLLCFIATKRRRNRVKDSGPACRSTFWYYLKVMQAVLKFKNDSETALLSILRSIPDNGEIYYSTFILKTLMVTQPDSVIELQNSALWSDRPRGRALESSGEGRGLMLRNGPIWKELRSYSFKTINKLGLSRRTNLEDNIGIELKDLFCKIDNLVVETGNRVQVKNLFSLATMNVMWNALAGTRFNEETPEYIMLRDAFQWKVELSAIKYFVYEIFGGIIKYAPSLFGYEKHCKGTQALNNYFKDFVEKREKMRRNGDVNYDFTECFLEQIELHKNSSNEVLRNVYTKEELVSTLMDLISTGMDTSKTALEHTVMFMCKYPDAQRKIQEEIEAVIGTDIFPSYSEHAKKMPYAVASLMEMKRMGNILAFNARVVTQDFNFKGITIEKGTFAMLHLHNVNMDDAFWGDPNVFRPERFLDSKMDFINENVNRNMAFGSGARRCPGQEMGTVYGFLVLTGLLQRYDLRSTDDSQLLQLEDKAMGVNTVKPFLMSVTQRT